MHELTSLSATELAALLRAGSVSTLEVVEAHLSGIDSIDPAVNAVVARDDEAARRRAHELDDAFMRSGPVGPFHGVPFTVKDWIDAAGLPCAGEGLDRDRRPEADATAVARLRQAGAVLLAKTNVGVDHPLFGPCHHPLDPARSPGGSSSGEASIIAAHGSPVGLASDSGGSIRLPAAWCGVVGFKPTHGLVPMTGHSPRIGALHDGRTVIGPLARSVADTWSALHVIAGPDGLDPGAVPVALGDPATVSIDGLRFASAGDMSEAARRSLVGLGAIETDALPDGFCDQAMEITQRYWHRTELSGAEADRLLWDWDRYRRRLFVALADVDVVLSPVVPGPAPVARPMTDEDYAWTLPWSLTGSPALSLPVGRTVDGLPLAVQIAGRPWADHVVAAVGMALERELGYE